MVLSNESIDSRPPIPAGVIDWPDAAKLHPPLIERAELFLFGVVSAAFLVACGIAFINVTTTLAEAKLAHASASRIPVVETRLLSIEMSEQVAPTVAARTRSPRS